MNLRCNQLSARTLRRASPLSVSPTESFFQVHIFKGILYFFSKFSVASFHQHGSDSVKKTSRILIETSTAIICMRFLFTVQKEKRVSCISLNTANLKSGSKLKKNIIVEQSFSFLVRSANLRFWKFKLERVGTCAQSYGHNHFYSPSYTGRTCAVPRYTFATIYRYECRNV